MQAQYDLDNYFPRLCLPVNFLVQIQTHPVLSCPSASSTKFSHSGVFPFHSHQFFLKSNPRFLFPHEVLKQPLCPARFPISWILCASQSARKPLSLIYTDLTTFLLSLCTLQPHTSPAESIWPLPLKMIFPSQVKVTCICNPGTPQVEAGELQTQGQPGIDRNFKTGLDYTARPCLKERGTLRPLVPESTVAFCLSPPGHQTKLTEKQFWS